MRMKAVLWPRLLLVSGWFECWETPNFVVANVANVKAFVERWSHN